VCASPRAAACAEARIAAHCPRPLGHPAHVRRRRGHVPRQDRRALRRRLPVLPSDAPVHGCAPLGGAISQSPLGGGAAARRARRRRAEPVDPPPACRFHTRCWKAQQVCQEMSRSSSQRRPATLALATSPSPGTRSRQSRPSASRRPSCYPDAATASQVDGGGRASAAGRGNDRVTGADHEVKRDQGRGEPSRRREGPPRNQSVDPSRSVERYRLVAASATIAAIHDGVSPTRSGHLSAPGELSAATPRPGLRS
jgi:hypothetical protein